AAMATGARSMRSPCTSFVWRPFRQARTPRGSRVASSALWSSVFCPLSSVLCSLAASPHPPSGLLEELRVDPVHAFELNQAPIVYMTIGPADQPLRHGNASRHLVVTVKDLDALPSAKC